MKVETKPGSCRRQLDITFENTKSKNGRGRDKIGRFDVR